MRDCITCNRSMDTTPDTRADDLCVDDGGAFVNVSTATRSKRRDGRLMYTEGFARENSVYYAALPKLDVPAGGGEAASCTETYDVGTVQSLRELEDVLRRADVCAWHSVEKGEPITQYAHVTITADIYSSTHPAIVHVYDTLNPSVDARVGACKRRASDDHIYVYAINAAARTK